MVLSKMKLDHEIAGALSNLRYLVKNLTLELIQESQKARELYQLAGDYIISEWIVNKTFVEDHEELMSMILVLFYAMTFITKNNKEYRARMVGQGKVKVEAMV